jgi:hypothetical protein
MQVCLDYINYRAPRLLSNLIPMMYTIALVNGIVLAVYLNLAYNIF